MREEIAELRRLAALAAAIESEEGQAKLAKLKELLQGQRFFAEPDKRLLIFTEFKDTLDMLVDTLRRWGYRVGFIHGGMAPGSRDEPGTRLWAEQQFREGATQIVVATEAAGEGINLQVCHILFNYDIPWNPNRLEQRMGRIHRYGQQHDCLIFNFVATNTVEGRVLQRLLAKLQEIRDALDDDTVFNVVGEVLPAAHVERVFRDYYAGKLGDADLEERLLQPVDERRFRAICQNALEGLAATKLNLAMLIERRARAQERRVVPETVARFLREAAPYANLDLREVPHLPYTFEPGRTPLAVREYERAEDWRLSPLAAKYPRCSTDRETAERHRLEWVAPGHPLFEALRRHTYAQAAPHFARGACMYSLQHQEPARLDFYRARVVDGLGQVVQERLFTLEIASPPPGSENHGEPAGASTAPWLVRLSSETALANLTPARPPADLPAVATAPEPWAWLYEHALAPFLEEVNQDRAAELQRIAEHVHLALTELLQRADEEIGKALEEKENGVPGAEGRLAQAENRHAELLARRERRRKELERQGSVTLQAVERVASVLVLPHPQREVLEVQRLQPNVETEATAMRVVMEYEQSQGRQVYDVHAKNLGYDLTSLDLNSGELRLIEVKGLAQSAGRILLTPNERRVAEDRRDCYWLYVVTNCASQPTLQDPIKDPARFPWHEVTQVAHYWLELNAVTQPMQVREDSPPFGGSS